MLSTDAPIWIEGLEANLDSRTCELCVCVPLNLEPPQKLWPGYARMEGGSWKKAWKPWKPYMHFGKHCLLNNCGQLPHLKLAGPEPNEGLAAPPSSCAGGWGNLPLAADYESAPPQPLLSPQTHALQAGHV